MSAILFEELEKSDLRPMNIAVVTATELEMQPIRAYLSERLFLRRYHRFDLLVSGVGMLHTVHALTRLLIDTQPELVIQAGVGGCFHPLRHPIGSCVAVGSEMQGDLGVMEPGDGWKSLPEMGLMDPNHTPYENYRLPNPHEALLQRCELPIVNGVTVNRVTTEPALISKMAHDWSAGVESMEGAAFHYVCLQAGIPFLQLRGLSNLVGDRDKSRWHMTDALNAVREALFHTIDRLQENRP